MLEEILKEFNCSQLNNFVKKIKPELLEDSIRVEVKKFSSAFTNIYGIFENGLTLEIIIYKNDISDTDTITFYIRKKGLPIEKIEFFLLHKKTIEEYNLDNNCVIRHDYFTVAENDIATTFNASYSFNDNVFLNGLEQIRKVKYHNIVRYAGRDNLSNFAANLSIGTTPILFKEDKKIKEEPIIEAVSLKRSHKRKKTIAIMLDIANTSNNITDDKAQIFIKQIEYLRRKFDAEEATISISTHFCDSIEIKNVLNVLNRNLTANIKFGINFFKGGTYDFENDQEDKYSDKFNKDKVETFDRYYISNPELDTKWFSVIDDDLASNIYKKYQYKCPMLAIRPSRSTVSNNNLMKYDTETYAFDGVIEGIEQYIKAIDKLTAEEILTEQKNFVEPISLDISLVTKIKEHDYAYIERYFKEGYATDDDYYDVLRWKDYLYHGVVPTKEEYASFMNIISMLLKRFEELNDEYSIKSIMDLKRILKRNFN